METIGANWTCPFCGRHTTITSPNYHEDSNRVRVNNSALAQYLVLTHVAIVCPNPDCRQLTFHVRLSEANDPQRVLDVREELQSWQLLPESSAKPQPEYIPKSLRDDYLEAARIVSLSPKASATLSRRCLQGMIRDFWKTPKRPNLRQEIEAIRDKVDPQTWAAIDAVRSVGNVGAHMEHDIDKIIDVEPREATLLVELIETLFQDWYVNRHERNERMKAIIGTAKSKEEQRNGPAAAQVEEVEYAASPPNEAPHAED